MNRWVSDAKRFPGYFFHPRNLLSTVQAFAYVFTAKAVLDVWGYWRRGDSDPYVEVDAVWIRDTASIAFLFGLWRAWAYWNDDRKKGLFGPR